VVQPALLLIRKAAEDLVEQAPVDLRSSHPSQQQAAPPPRGAAWRQASASARLVAGWSLPVKVTWG
jgi:hypothetical protein